MALAPFGPEKLTSVGSVPVSRKVKDVPVVRGREVQLFPRTLDPLVIDAAIDFAVTMEDYRMMVRFSTNGGKKEYSIDWPDMEKDMRLITQILEVLADPDLDDSTFRQSIFADGSFGDSIESLLMQSELFSRLKTEYNGGHFSPLRHILEVLNKLETDSEPETRVFWRISSFFHDLGGKALNYQNRMHGMGSAVVAWAFFDHANAVAEAEKRKKYDPELVETTIALCLYHHLFEVLQVREDDGYLHPELNEALLAIGYTNELIKKGLGPTPDQVQEVFVNFVQAYGYQDLIDINRFKKNFPELWQFCLENPDFLYDLARFTVLDISTNPAYEVFLTGNAFLYDCLAAQMALEQGAQPVDNPEMN